MNRCEVPTAGVARGSRSILAAAALLIPIVAGDAAAQSDAGSVNATVTIQSDAVSVIGAQDLDFGTHFATDGVVPNEQAGAWQIDVSTSPTIVDLALTVLPAFLVGPPPDGFLVPLTYSPLSFGAQCGGIFVTTTPDTGIADCEVNVGEGFAFLGEDLLLGVPLEPVEVDLTGATAGTYTAVIELTATVN